MKIFFRKFLTLFLVFNLIFNPIIVVAEEEIATPSASTTVTGDSEATAQTSIIANTTEASSEAEINIKNDAVVEEQTISTASSGLNLSETSSGSAIIETGDATASAITDTIINLNNLTASQSSETNLENTAEVDTSTSAVSESGGNNASASGETAQIITGDSYASAAVSNIINTNLIGSNYRFLIYNIYQNQTGNIDLNEIWKELETSLGGANLTAGVKNTAVLESVLDVKAISGQNTATNSAGKVVVVTGNSYASASLFNLVNTNAVGANFLFVVINIFGTLNGDVIAPSPERFSETLANRPELKTGEVTLSNYARVEGSNVLARANSGSNSNIGGENQVATTGNAYASATTIDVVNTNISWQNWMNFIINDFGMRSDSVRGWNEPTIISTIDKPSEGTTQNTSVSVEASNSAQVTEKVSALADSGNNQAVNVGGENNISTGRAVALANVVNFINTNIIGGNFIFAFINLFGNWNGNFVFAYPDLQINVDSGTKALQPGQETHLTVNYKNIGYEAARDGKVAVNLPIELTYEGNDLNLVPLTSGQMVIFSVGSVKSGEGGQIIIKARVRSDINFDQQQASGFSLIRPVYAAEKQKDLIVNVMISTSDKQADTVRHSSEVKISVSPTPENNSNGEKGLYVTSWNNVGDFVYPGDIVTFEVSIKNTGDQAINNVLLSQEIRDGVPLEIGNTAFDIGTINAGETIKVSYGVLMPDDAKEEVYQSKIIASADGVTSNDAINTFLIKLKNTSIVPVVLAQDIGNITQAQEQMGQVEGIKIERKTNYLPYLIILAGLILTAYKVFSAFRKRKNES